MEKKRPVIVQKILWGGEDPLSKAIKYYSVLSVLNNLQLSEMQINLLAFTAVKGTISSGGAKEQFCALFNTSKPSIGNIIHKLTVKGLLIKINNRIKVIDPLQMDFNKDLLLNIKIKQNENTN